MNYRKMNKILADNVGKNRAWVIRVPPEISGDGYDWCLQFPQDITQEEIDLATKIVDAIYPTTWFADKAYRTDKIGVRR